MASLRSLMPGFGTAVRLTATLVIWGMAIFLIFTVPVWKKQQQQAILNQQTSQYVSPLQIWLTDMTAPLERFVSDSRARIGLSVQGGINSLPVQRALGEASVYFSLPDLYMVETHTQTVATSPGASTLPKEILARLGELAHNNASRVLLALGKRSGMVYAALKLEDAPKNMDVWVISNLTLGQMSARWPDLVTAKDNKIGLTLPHTAGVARWDPDHAELTLQPSPMQATPASHLMGQSPLPPWQDVNVTLTSPLPADSRGLSLQLAIGMVALIATFLVWWSSNVQYVQVLRQRMESLVSRLQPLVKKLARLKKSFARPRVQPPIAPPDPIEEKAEPLVKATFDPLPDWPEHTPAPEASLEPPSEAPKKRRWKAPSPVEKKPLNPREEADVEMLEILKTCLKNNLLELHYQPIYRVTDSMPVLHEVFARLVHPGDGHLIMPGTFLPLAIRHNLTFQLDLAVFKKVYQTHFLGAVGPATPLALNISSTSLDGLDYMQEMAIQGPKVLQKLAFEVRSQEMARDSRALKLLKEIQKQGGNLAVDYFGGGPDMLRASKQVGFNYVKLDATTILPERDGKETLKNLCQGAHQIGLPVILEKVGDQATEMLVRRAGATYMQGFGLATPAKTLSTSPLPPRLAGLAAIVDSFVPEGS